MTFIQALFLFGAAGVAGPIAAHLLVRPRYRRIPFTMLRFLRSGDTETQSRRRLKNLLVLLIRCAIIVLLAFFFAGPERLLVTTEAAAPPQVFLGIDDSLSMAYGDDMARAISDAREFIRSAPADARFSAFAFASGASARDVDRFQAEAFAAGLTAVPMKSVVLPFFNVLGAAGKRGGKLSVHIISDFTPQVRDALEAITNPATVDHYSYTRVGPKVTPANVAITEAHVLPSADGHWAVSVGLANYEPSGTTVVVKGIIADAPAGEATVQLGAAEKRSAQLLLSPKRNAGPFLPVEISLTPDDAMLQDNHYFVGLAGSEVSAKHVVIFAASEREAFLVKTALETLAQSNPLSALTVQALTHSQFESSVVRNASTVVFASAPDRSVLGIDDITAFVQGGGRLIGFTNKDLKPDFYAALARAGVFPAVPGTLTATALQLVGDFGSVTYGDSLSPDGYAIRSLRNYRLDQMPITGAYAAQGTEGSEALWRFNTGSGFVYYKACGRGSAILVNTSADDTLSPLMKSPAAVAFISYLIGGGAQLRQYAFDAGEPVRLPASAFELAHAQDSQTFIVKTPTGKETPAQWVNQTLSVAPVSELGWVRTAAAPIRFAGVNAPPGETDLTAPAKAPLDALMQRLFSVQDTAVASEAGEGSQRRKPLWPALGWTALGLILVDVFVSNRVAR